MAVDRDGTLVDVYQSACVLNDHWLNRVQTYECSFFELNKFSSVGGSSLDILDKRRIDSFFTFFLSLNYLLDGVLFFLLGPISVEEEATGAFGNVPDEWQIQRGCFSCVTWNLPVHVNEDINPALMVSYYTSSLSITNVFLPVRT